MATDLMRLKNKKIVLLEDALRDVLRKIEVLNYDTFPTGPELLLAASDYVDHINKVSLRDFLRQHGYCQEDISHIACLNSMYGIDAATNYMAERNDDEHDYGTELKWILEEWQTRKDLSRSI